MSIRKNRIIFAVIMASMLSLVLAVPALAARIGVPQNVRWEGAVACWDEVDDAYQYEIILYKDGAKFKNSIRTKSTSINLAGRMKEKGKYTFSVRVNDRVSDEYGRYSVKSGTYVQEKNLTSKRRRTTDSTTPGKEAGERSPGPGVVGHNWRQNDYGWWYDNGDGSYLAGGWQQIGQKWYYFNAEGYLMTGWLMVDGQQYYTYDDGSRITGWSEIDGDYFYFDDNGVYNPDIMN